MVFYTRSAITVISGQICVELETVFIHYKNTTIVKSQPWQLFSYSVTTIAAACSRGRVNFQQSCASDKTGFEKSADMITLCKIHHCNFAIQYNTIHTHALFEAWTSSPKKKLIVIPEAILFDMFLQGFKSDIVRKLR